MEYIGENERKYNLKCVNQLNELIENDTNCENPIAILNKLSEYYDIDRIKYVLAVNLNALKSDNQFLNSNIEWAAIFGNVENVEMRLNVNAEYLETLVNCFVFMYGK